MRTSLAFALGLLLAAALPARADVAPRQDFDNQTRLVVGVTVSGHILLSVGLEHLVSEDWSLRGELLWAIAEVPAFGVQGDLTRRWRLDGGDDRNAARARWGLLSAGYLRLFAREKPGLWRQLPLWHLSPGHRWSLDDAGALDLELPICWFHEKRRVIPIGLQMRWQGREPLID